MLLCRCEQSAQPSMCQATLGSGTTRLTRRWRKVTQPGGRCYRGARRSCRHIWRGSARKVQSKDGRPMMRRSGSWSFRSTVGWESRMEPVALGVGWRRCSRPRRCLGPRGRCPWWAIDDSMTSKRGGGEDGSCRVGGGDLKMSGEEQQDVSQARRSDWNNYCFLEKRHPRVAGATDRGVVKGSHQWVQTEWSLHNRRA